jgi:hypothetical protein
MRYSLMCILLFSSVTYANDYDLINTYKELDNKINECLSYMDRDVVIDNEYLLSITDKQRKAVLLVLSQNSKRDCYMKEENNYALSVLNFAIETGNNQPLHEFIALRKMDAIDNAIIDIINELDQRSLKEIKELPQFNKPFNPFNVVNE